MSFRQLPPTTLEMIREAATGLECTPFGFGPDTEKWSKGHVLEVEVCRQFIALDYVFKFGNTWSRASSYNYKHRIEELTQAADNARYIGNGSFIIAAKLEGLNIRKIAGSRNAQFRR